MVGLVTVASGVAGRDFRPGRGGAGPAAEDGGLHVTTGPAVTYWNPANVAKGDYTVKATFKLTNVGDKPLTIAGKPEVQVLQGC